MRGSRRLLLLGLGLWLAAVGVVAMANYSFSFRARFTNLPLQLQRADAATPGPRIFLVGSSGCLYGLSAAQVQRRIGAPTFNLCLSEIGTQVDELLATIDTHIHPGDLVVLVERQTYAMQLSDDAIAGRSALTRAFAAVRAVPYLRSLLAGIDNRNATTGDVIAYPSTGPGKVPDYGDTPSLARHTKGWDRLIRHRIADLRARGAKVVVATAPMLIADSDAPALRFRNQELQRWFDGEFGAGVWIPPLLTSQTGIFLSDGLHTSEAGRLWWSDALAAKLAGQLPH